MKKHYIRKTRPMFALEPLRPSHLEEVAAWLGRRDWRFRPWSHRENAQSLVMTINGRPVFYLSVLAYDGTSGEIYILPSPQWESSVHRLIRVWYMASVYAFLPMGLSWVRAVARVDSQVENEALQLLGYRLVDTCWQTSGRMNEYACGRKEMRMVM